MYNNIHVSVINLRERKYIQEPNILHWTLHLIDSVTDVNIYHAMDRVVDE
jgi:hypothetical protein